MEPNESAVRELGSAESPEPIVHEYDAETPASTAVVHAICAVTNVDPHDAPTELGFVLYEHVDPGALDTLLGDGTGDGETVVSFEIAGEQTYAVDISDDGRIEVRRSRSSG
ncbi:HalOD1 output domain-containing protein [Natronorubrum sp. DTA28]|uniref:HalOD1 output domain-containing protein n=1 Tax=Natronorubrum sp. DTA28 TaxID=3447019 RepID=UPI003F85DA21